MWLKTVSHTFEVQRYSSAAAKSLQSCLTLWDPIDGSPPGSSVPGILQARILEWVAISFSNACRHAKSLQSLSNSVWPYGQQPTRLLHPRDSPGKNTGVGCHFLLQGIAHLWLIQQVSLVIKDLGVWHYFHLLSLASPQSIPHGCKWL